MPAAAEKGLIAGNSVRPVDLWMSYNYSTLFNTIWSLIKQIIFITTV